MIKKKIIFNEFYNENKIKIINHLYKKYNWEPVFTLGLVVNDDNMLNHINTLYPSCITVNSLVLRQAQFDYSKFKKTMPIDSEVLSSLANHALNYLSDMPDSTGYNYTYEQRKSYYYDILNYWNTVIKNLKPDIFVSYTFPHTHTCLSLYLLCKHHYNIQTLFINPHPLLNKNYFIIGSSIERMDQPITKIYESKESLILKEEVKNYLKEIRSKNATWPDYIIDTYRFLDQTSKVSLSLKNFCKIIIKTIMNGYGFKIQTDWKKNRKPYNNIKSRMNNFDYFFFTQKIKKKNKKLKVIYDNLVTKVDYSKNYIYFASQYQPEATTAQIGSYYENYHLVLDILSAAIPQNWIIYYKENPAIFSNSNIILSSLRRDENYYKKIIDKKNIQLISSDTNTFDLIDNSKAVATVTGTATWEAVARGKPAMSFARTWYSGCKSIFLIKSFNDAKEAINKIVNGYNPDQNDINRYAASIEKVASKKILEGAIFDIELKKFDKPDEILTFIADSFYKSYLDFYNEKN